jgi:hypothetical protein
MKDWIKIMHLAETSWKIKGFTQFEFEYFFHYSTLWVLKESIYNKNVIPRAVLRN